MEMDERLKQLKENMDNTVLKNLDFRNKNKYEVRRGVYKNKKTNTFHHLFPRILSICFFSLFILGIGFFTVENSGLLPKNEEKLSSLGDKKDAKPDKEGKNDNIYTPPAQPENYNEFSKDDVLNRLLNSVDNFHSASGKFEFYNKYFDNSTTIEMVEYKISNKNIIGGFEKEISNPEGKVHGQDTATQELYYNDHKKWLLRDDNKTFSSYDYTVEPRREIVKPKDVFSIKLNKLKFSADKFREKPPEGPSHISLFPNEITAKYLRFTNLWNIEKQNEKLLGHNTIVIYGSIDKSIVNFEQLQPQEKKFRLWVDKDTGILLKYEVYDEKEKSSVTFTLKVYQ